MFLHCVWLTLVVTVQFHLFPLMCLSVRVCAGAHVCVHAHADANVAAIVYVCIIQYTYVYVCIWL